MKVEHHSDGFETKIHLVLDSGYRLSTSFIDDDAGDVNTTNDSALLVIAEANAIVSQTNRISELEVAINTALMDLSDIAEQDQPLGDIRHAFNVLKSAIAQIAKNNGAFEA